MPVYTHCYAVHHLARTVQPGRHTGMEKCLHLHVWGSPLCPLREPSNLLGHVQTLAQLDPSRDRLQSRQLTFHRNAFFLQYNVYGIYLH